MPETLASATVPFARAGGAPRLDDLWFLVGSRCNLSCIHCYVGSSPSNDDLEQLTLDEVRRFLDEGARHGLAHVYFSGGEPFVNRDVLAMLAAALEDGRRVTVLTNATRPLERSLDEVVALACEADGRLDLRVSLDHYEPARHDAIRGPGTFERTVDVTAALARAGIRPIVTTTAEVLRGRPLTPDQVELAFTDVFARRGVSVDVKILPAVLEMGSQLERVDGPREVAPPTEAALAARGVDKASLMCSNGRSVLKRDGRVRVYPCPIIHEVPEYDLGGTLEASFAVPVPLAHRACATYCCPEGGTRGSCTN